MRSGAAQSAALSETTRVPVDGRLRIRAVLDDRPLPSTELFVLPWTERLEALASRAVGLPESARLAALRSLTDDEGLARFSVDDDSPHLIVGRGPGSAPAGVLAEPTVGVITLELPPERTIHGSTWCWPEKTRLPGALVRARRAFDAERRYGDAFDPIDRIAGMFFSSEVRSDPDGLYRLGGLPAGRVFVIATAGGRAAVHYFDRILPVDAPIPLSLIAGLPVSGRVIDAETDTPMDGVRVISVSLGIDGSGWESDFTYTDADGRFSLAVPIDGDNDFGVKASRDGYATSVHEVSPDRTEDVTVRLEKVPSSEVLVVNADGEPVPQPSVHVYEVASEQIVQNGRGDAEGVFRLFLDPEKQVDVAVSASGYANERMYRVDPSVFPLTITLDRVGALTGTVTSSGAPVGAAVVRARRDRGIGVWVSDDRVLSNSDDGTFRIDDLDPGDYVVDVHAPDDAPGHAPARYELSIEPGETRSLLAELPRGASISGTVRSAATGTPIAGAQVSLADLFRHGAVSGAIPGGVTTDAHGRFTLGGVPPGLTRILVEHERYVTFGREVEVGERTPPVDIRLDAPGSLVVRMTRPGSVEPIEFMAYVTPESGRKRLVRTMAGELRVDALPPGRVDVTAQAPQTTVDGRSLRRTFSGAVDIEPGRTGVLEFVLEGDTSIRGEVELPPATPVSPTDFWVSVHPAGPTIRGGSNGVSVDVNGRFEIPMVPHGDVLVVCSARKDGLSISEVRRVHLTEGEVRALKFRPAVSGLRGQVTDSTGRGLRASARIRSAAPTPGPWTSFGTDDDGRFQHHRGPGPVQWVVGAEGFGTRVRSALIPDGATMLDERTVLHPEARLLVQLEDLAGEPVGDAAVSLQPLALPDAEDATRRRGWGAGRWMIRRIGAGTHTLGVSAPGFVTHRAELRFTPGDRRTAGVTLRRAVDLELFVVDSANAALTGEVVRIEPAEGEGVPVHEARTDGAGRLVVRLPEGRYELVVRDSRDPLDLTGESGPLQAVLTVD